MDGLGVVWSFGKTAEVDRGGSSVSTLGEGQWKTGIPGKKLSVIRSYMQFLARVVIYTSRAYATMSVSVCLSVCL